MSDMLRLIVSSIVLSLTASFASSEIKRMSDEVIVEVVRKIAPDKEIKHRLDAINPPTMVFVWHGSSGEVQDVMSEKDPFTGDKKYLFSRVYCTYEVTFFTPILNTEVHVDADIYVEVRDSIGYKSLNSGTAILTASQKIFRSVLEGDDPNITFAGNMVGHNRDYTNYSSNSEANAAIDDECSLSNLEVFELREGFMGKGYLIRGNTDRLPEYGNTTVFIMD